MMNNQLGQDQPFLNLPSSFSAGVDGMPGGSLISPSFRFFPGPNGTPTGWSPRFNMFTPFGQSPTSGFPIGLSPFGQTPTGGLQPQQPVTPNALKPPFAQDSDNKDSITAGLPQIKQESEPVSPSAHLFPHLPQYSRSPQFTETSAADSLASKNILVSGMMGTDSSSVSRSPAAMQQQQVRGAKPSGRGRRGRRPPTSPILTNAASVGMQSMNTETSPDASSSSTTSPVSPSGRKRQVRRPPPLNVSPRSQELNAGDVPASSFRLVVGASKLCKFRRYTVTLTVPKAWRIESGLTEEKVMKALLDAKCCRSGTAVIAGCTRCKCQPVVNLTNTSKTTQASSSTEDYENYVCSIRTRCSSSRDHLKSSLTLVIDGLPVSEYIVSNTFVLLARDKTQAPKRARSYDLSQGGIDSEGSDDDDEDDKGHKSGGGMDAASELPRKSPHRAGAVATRRRQQSHQPDVKNGTKPSAATSAAATNEVFMQKQMKSETSMAVNKGAPTTFPPQSSSASFPPAVLRREDAVVAAAVAAAAVVPNTDGTSSRSSSSSRGGDYASSGTNSAERLYGATTTGAAAAAAATTTMETGSQGSVVFSAGGGKTQSPIQPSSVSLPSPSPCTTPTGMFCDTTMNVNFEGPQMEQMQMGWPLSPMMSGTSPMMSGQQ